MSNKVTLPTIIVFVLWFDYYMKENVQFVSCIICLSFSRNNICFSYCNLLSKPYLCRAGYLVHNNRLFDCSPLYINVNIDTMWPIFYLLVNVIFIVSFVPCVHLTNPFMWSSRLRMTDVHTVAQCSLSSPHCFTFHGPRLD